VPKNSIATIKQTWKEISDTPVKRVKLYGGTVIIFAIMATLPIFFNKIEKRHGVVLHDWVLAHIPPHNVSVFIFIIIWGTGLLTLYRALYQPTIYLLYCWALIFVCIARMTSIYLVALDPPVGLIPLSDPLTGIFYGQAVIVKDLFFSGHMSTLMLMPLCLEKRSDKTIGFIGVCIVAVLLLVQHIHYTIDVLAAPVVAFTMYRAARWFMFYGTGQK
jgi:hypothetical protein